MSENSTDLKRKDGLLAVYHFSGNLNFFRFFPSMNVFEN